MSWFEPPDYVINPYTHKPSGYRYMGSVYSDAVSYPECVPKQKDVTEDGVYHILATGSYYQLRLNGQWYGDNNMYWKDYSSWPGIFYTGTLEESYPDGIPEFQLVNAGIIPYCNIELEE